jgi:hypothetical protein
MKAHVSNSAPVRAILTLEFTIASCALRHVVSVPRLLT